MSYLELFLLAVGLCFDTFAVSLTGAICMNVRLKWFQILKIIIFFAFFQAGFTALGYLLGVSVSSYIEKWDHWIAFLLLLYIGGKMVLESFSKDECGSDGSADSADSATSATSASSANSDNSADSVNSAKMNLLSTKQLSFLSIATSIDALAVGISLAIISLQSLKFWIGEGMIFAVTALSSLAGLLGGRCLGGKFGKRSELVGGVILVAIGVKILIEHLFLQ